MVRSSCGFVDLSHPMKSHSTAAEKDGCVICGRRDADNRNRDIRVLEQRIAELEAENLRLVAASNYFGALAERLNERLKQRAARRSSDSGTEPSQREHPTTESRRNA